MTAEFEHYCWRGRNQREVTWNDELMLPILVLETPGGLRIIGLEGEADFWPGMFQEIAKVHTDTTAAVLTVDTYLRLLEPDEVVTVRPKEDPQAINSVLVTRVTADTQEARQMPYAINDDGSFTWLEERHVAHCDVADVLKVLVRA